MKDAMKERVRRTVQIELSREHEELLERMARQLGLTKTSYVRMITIKHLTQASETGRGPEMG